MRGIRNTSLRHANCNVAVGDGAVLGLMPAAPCTADGKGAPPFWGWGVAAPAPVRDGRAPANRSLSDSWFTNCEYAAF
jgi:hypothetical protein